MKLQSFRIMMFVLTGVLFLSITSVYAETAEEYYNSGNACYKQGNYDQAISDYTKTIEINPNIVEAYNNRGGAYIHKGKYEQAISDCTMAIKLEPDYAYAYNNRAGAYYDKKEYDKAWADVHKAEELGATVDSQFLEDLKKASGKEK